MIASHSNFAVFIQQGETSVSPIYAGPMLFSPKGSPFSDDRPQFGGPVIKRQLTDQTEYNFDFDEETVR